MIKISHSRNSLRVFFVVFLMCVSSVLVAQEAIGSIDSLTIPIKTERNLRIIPLPAIGYNPTSGFMIGVAPSLTWTLGDPKTTHLSSALATLIYTSKKQFLFTCKSTAFLDGDSWELLGDWRYFITSQPTYGLGTGPQSARLASNGFEYDDNLYSSPVEDEQMMDFNYLRLHETFLKRIGDTRYYAGLGYHLDIHSKIDDNLLNLESDPEVITSHYAYSIENGFNPEKYTTSGLSLNGMLDSRDNVVNPYSGQYAFLSFRVNPDFLGSTKTSSLLWAEYRHYFILSKARPRHQIACWAYGNFVTSGDVPYLDLPALGWDQFGRSGRAYTQGRFRADNTLLYVEAEYRFPLMKNNDLIGGVVFVNATTANNPDANISIGKYIDPAAGVGLRVMINKKTRANLCLDYAIGMYGSSGFYFGMNEAF